MRKFAALMLAALVAAFAGAQEKVKWADLKVSHNQATARMPVVLQELSEKTDLRITCAASLNSTVIVVAAKDVKLTDLLSKIALVADCNVTFTDKGAEFFEPQTFFSDQENRDEIRKHIQRQIDGLVKGTSANDPYQPENAAKLRAVLDRHSSPGDGQMNHSAAYQQIAQLASQSPSRRLLARVLSTIGAGPIAELQDGKVVTIPGGQLNGKEKELLQGLSQEQKHWSEALRGIEYNSRNYYYGAGYGDHRPFGSMGPTAIETTLMRTGTQISVTVEVLSGGRVATSISHSLSRPNRHSPYRQTSLTSPYNEPWFRKVQQLKISLPDEIKKVQQAMFDLRTGKQNMSAELRREFLDPVRNEPLAYTPVGQGLIQISESAERPLVAHLSDASIHSIAYENEPQGQNLTGSNIFQLTYAAPGMHEGWIVLRPYRNGSIEPNVDRFQFKKHVARVATGECLSFEEFATLYDQYRQQWNYLPQIWFRAAMPMFDYVHPFNFQFLDFYLNLTPSQRRDLFAGGLKLGSLGPKAFEYARQMHIYMPAYQGLYNEDGQMPTMPRSRYRQLTLRVLVQTRMGLFENRRGGNYIYFRAVDELAGMSQSFRQDRSVRFIPAIQRQFRLAFAGQGPIDQSLNHEYRGNVNQEMVPFDQLPSDVIRTIAAAGRRNGG